MVGLELSLQPPHEGLFVEPGQQATCDVRVRNSGTQMLKVSFEVLGDVSSWTTIGPPEFGLFPDTTGIATLRFQPPRNSSTSAGPCPFAVKASIAGGVGSSTVEEGTIHIDAVHSVELSLVPHRVSGIRHSRHRLVVTNTGNSSTTISLAAADPDELLMFRISPSRFDIASGETISAKLVATSHEMGRAEHPFTVTAATPASKSSAASTQGMMAQRSLMSIRTGIGAALIGAAAGWLYRNPPAGSIRPASWHQLAPRSRVDKTRRTTTNGARDQGAANQTGGQSGSNQGGGQSSGNQTGGQAGGNQTGGQAGGNQTNGRGSGSTSPATLPPPTESTRSPESIAVRSNGELDVVARGPGNELDYYWKSPGLSWAKSLIGQAGSTFASPGIFVRSSSEADVVAQGPITSCSTTGTSQASPTGAQPTSEPPSLRRRSSFAHLAKPTWSPEVPTTSCSTTGSSRVHLSGLRQWSVRTGPRSRRQRSLSTHRKWCTSSLRVPVTLCWITRPLPVTPSRPEARSARMDLPMADQLLQ